MAGIEETDVEVNPVQVEYGNENLEVTIDSNRYIQENDLGLFSISQSSLSF